MVVYELVLVLALASVFRVSGRLSVRLSVIVSVSVRDCLMDKV